MYCFKFYIYIGAMCVHVCVCAHTHVHASACVRVGRVCGCASTLEKEGRRERRAGTTHDTVGVR